MHPYLCSALLDTELLPTGYSKLQLTTQQMLRKERKRTRQEGETEMKNHSSIGKQEKREIERREREIERGREIGGEGES